MNHPAREHPSIWTSATRSCTCRLTTWSTSSTPSQRFRQRRALSISPCAKSSSTSTGEPSTYGWREKVHCGFTSPFLYENRQGVHSRGRRMTVCLESLIASMHASLQGTGRTRRNKKMFISSAKPESCLRSWASTRGFSVSHRGNTELESTFSISGSRFQSPQRLRPDVGYGNRTCEASLPGLFEKLRAGCIST